MLLFLGFSLRSMAMSLSIESPAFTANSLMPTQFTCDGADSSPPLVWQDTANNTQSYALIVDDPDAPAGVWTHWVLFNIPAKINQLAVGATIPAEAISSKNSWGGTGYQGPCPPSGVHRYFFKLYALDSMLNLNESATKEEVEQAMQGHIIDSSELIGLYKRQ